MIRCNPTIVQASTAPAAGITGKPTRPLRILYADDVRELRDVARIALGREGHTVECAADGDLALACFRSDRSFDLVITDHHMPNVNGLEFVTRLREYDFPGRIMVFSSELGELVARQYEALKVDRILYKPVLPSTLRQTLAELFPPSLDAAA
jgi:CheY-like chemotaxis protein